ncbi:hypothetical protein PF010_g4432 [Phytophthora fragariae]|uniref:MULE transposase domain-containing protein n=1 Tax=Phytophthora fragariae TaxID=53985 RepID=A0A6G0LRX0_9STRA|nr:hypothetical protein PF010_g4432 [Phytophthora fragariae]
MILDSEVIRRLAEYQHNLHLNQLFKLFSILESMASIEVTVEDADIAELCKMLLLRPDLDVCLDPVDQASFGTVSDHGNNVAAVTFETKKVVLQRCREFARARGFSIRVAQNSYRAQRQEGNVKYSCKVVKGQQPLIPGSTTKCPFFITVYGIRDCWKITKMCLAHDHFRHGGFQGDTFVDGGLANDLSRQRLRDVPYRVMRGVVEREMLPSYSGTWASVTGRSITDFLMAKGMHTNRTTASKIKRDLLESLRDDVIESYQKLEGYLAMVSDAKTPTAFGFQKHGIGLFSRACVILGACLQAMQHCKHVIGLDGTHLKGDMNKRGVFLLATTKDLEGHLLVFGIALVAQEDYSDWSWFLGNLKAAKDAVSNWKPAFVSDRQKGLLASVT